MTAVPVAQDQIKQRNEHQQSSSASSRRLVSSCWKMTLIGLILGSVKSSPQKQTTGWATAFLFSERGNEATRRRVSSSLLEKLLEIRILTSLPRSKLTLALPFRPSSIPSSALSLSSVPILDESAMGSGASTPSKINLDEESANEPVSIKTPSTFVGFPFAYHELVDVEIETLTNRGWGVARFDVSERKPDPSMSIGRPKKSKRGRTVAAAVHDIDVSNDVKTNDNDDSSEADKENDDETASDPTLQAMLDDTTAGSDTSRRWVIMVPNVIPGERVRVRIFRNFKNYSEGDLVSVLSASPDRVIPLCPVADDCGGCQLQHMAVAAQRKWKTQSVTASLAQYGIDTTVSPTLGTNEIFGYRSKITPHYQAPAKRKRGKNAVVEVDPTTAKTIQAIGFQRQTSRSILDVDHCPIATRAVNAKYAMVRSELLSQPSTKTKGATLLFRQANVEETDQDSSDVVNVSTNHQEYLTTRVRGLDFTYQAGNFFQNNYYVLPLMVDLVVEHASATANSRRMTHLVDCYCGSGLFALSAAAVFDTVVGIEINMKAVAEATANAARNDIANCHFSAAPSEAIFTNIQDYPRDSTVVVLDPPRKGCSTDFLVQLLDFAPQRIVYMSCDPTTQARDAQSILASEQYRITSVQPFDLFPQTRHIECLAIFERIEQL